VNGITASTQNFGASRAMLFAGGRGRRRIFSGCRSRKNARRLLEHFLPTKPENFRRARQSRGTERLVCQPLTTTMARSTDSRSLDESTKGISPSRFFGWD